MTAILRKSKSISVVIKSGEAESRTIDFSRYSGGHIIMPAGWTAASIQFKVSDSFGGVFVEYQDSAKAVVSIDTPAVDIAYMLPVDIFPAKYVKLWSTDGASADTNQGADREIKVILKV